MAGLYVSMCFLGVLLAGLGCESSAGTIVFSSVGDNVALPCGTNVHRSCSAIAWKLKERFDFFLDVVQSGKVIASDLERTTRLRVGQDCTLHISNLRTEDGGQYICEDEAANATTNLQLLIITVTPSAPLNTHTSASLHCYLTTAIGYVWCNHSGVSVHWVSEMGTKLQGDRYNISRKSSCYSVLTLTLQRTDHKRHWKCQLTEGTDMKATYSYITTLTDGVEEMFAAVGGSVTLPCSDCASPGMGGRLVWTLGGGALFSQSPDGDVTELDSRGLPGFTMNPDSSLTIKAASTAHSGYYQCIHVNGSGFNSTHRRILLYLLEVTADHTGDSQQNFNYTLTCSLTCADGCDKDLNLMWSRSAGGHQQGGAIVQRNNTLISQLFVPELQASETVACIVLREGLEKARQEWPIQHVPHAVTIAVFCVLLLVLAFCAVGVGMYWKRCREANTECVYGNTGMVRNVPLYEECGEPAYSRAERGSSGTDQLQMVNTIYALQS
ncbi:hypothetical protein MATL_G00130700 [Megalops atlanticus]|uniref:Ig-like domain-containing protein n=1 Tax=Megalops atlanticus TaxID=7932 RepID=A0A9D3Q0Q4_MEGAT|nr:hypothetical protein MATL_G00130700 [Megalops atlanticus]